jgi:hypothetical protein
MGLESSSFAHSEAPQKQQPVELDLGWNSTEESIEQKTACMQVQSGSPPAEPSPPLRRDQRPNPNVSRSPIWVYLSEFIVAADPNQLEAHTTPSSL